MHPASTTLAQASSIATIRWTRCAVLPIIPVFAKSSPQDAPSIMRLFVDATGKRTKTSAQPTQQEHPQPRSALVQHLNSASSTVRSTKTENRSVIKEASVRASKEKWLVRMKLAQNRFVEGKQDFAVPMGSIARSKKAADLTMERVFVLISPKAAT